MTYEKEKHMKPEIPRDSKSPQNTGFIVLETDSGSQAFTPAELHREDWVILIDSPRLWAEPWAVWQPDWRLIGTQTDLARHLVLTVVEIPDQNDRLITRLRWPTAGVGDLESTVDNNRLWVSEQLTLHLNSTKTPPKSQNGQVDH